MSSSLLLLLKKKKIELTRAAEEILFLERFPRARFETEWNTGKCVSSILTPPPPDTALRRAPRSLKSALHICNTTSSGTFLHMFWECPVVISLWTHVNLVLSSLLRIDWSVNPSLCLLNNDSSLCISSMQKRMLFAGFTAAKKTIIQNWFTPHMCRKTYWIRKPSANSDVWMCNGASWWGQAFDHWCLAMFSVWYTWLYKEVIFLFLLSFPLSLPFWLDLEMLSMCLLFCSILDAMWCYVWKNKKNVDDKKKKRIGNTSS